jgi:hypothetical protein
MFNFNDLWKFELAVIIACCLVAIGLWELAQWLFGHISVSWQ